MIHAHLLIEIKHFTKLHFNTEKFHKYMAGIMVNQFHIDLVIPGKSPEDLAWIKSYIHKEETGPAEVISTTQKS